MKASPDATVKVVSRAGELEGAATFDGGFLVDEATAWDDFSAYAAARAYAGASRPAANPNFRPAATLDASVDDAALAAAVAQNDFQRAFIENADGPAVTNAQGSVLSVYAAGTHGGAVHYILSDGTEGTLAGGQQIVLEYDEPTADQLALNEPAEDEPAAQDPADEEEPAATDEENKATDPEPSDDQQAQEPVDEAILASSLAQMLDGDESAEGFTVTVRAGDAEQDLTFAGGLLVSEGAAQDALPTYAQARASQGAERPAADPSFTPDIALGLFPNGTIASAVNDGMYRGAYIEDADGNQTQIVAARVYREDDATQVRAVDTMDNFVTVEDGDKVVLEFAAPHTTGGFLGIGAINALSDLLARAAEQGDSSLTVTVDNGSAQAQATFAGGLLVSEQAARASVPGYAEAAGDDAADALAFTPQLSLADGADGSLAASVAAGAYTGAYVNGEQIVAAATIDGTVLYATADGAVHELADGEIITVTYAAPAANNAQPMRAARSVQTMAVLQNEAGGIQWGQKIIYKQWQTNIQTNTMGFQGGTIDSSTVPHYGDGGGDYWPHDASGNLVPFAQSETFRGAYVLIGATRGGTNAAPTGGSRYAIDWLGVIDGKIYYRLTSTAATAQNNPIVLASELDTSSNTQFIIFHYDNSGSSIFNLNVTTSKGAAVDNNFYDYPSLTEVPTTIGTSDTITIRARRDAGTVLYLDNTGDLSKYFEVLQGTGNNLATADTNGYKGYCDSTSAGSLDVYWRLRLKSNANLPASGSTLNVNVITRSPGDMVGASIRLRSLDSGATDVGNNPNVGYKVGPWRAKRQDGTNLAFWNTPSHRNFNDKPDYLNPFDLTLAGGNGNVTTWDRSDGYNLTIDYITNDSTGGWNGTAGVRNTAFHPKQIYVISKNAQTGKEVRENILYPIADYKNITGTATNNGTRSYTYTFTQGDMAGATVTVTRTQKLVAPGANPTTFGDDPTIPTYKFEFTGLQTTFTLCIDYMSVSNVAEKVGDTTSVSVNYGDGVSNVRKVDGTLVKDDPSIGKNMLALIDDTGRVVPGNAMENGVVYNFDTKSIQTGSLYTTVEGNIGIRFKLSKDYSQNPDDIKVFFINRKGEQENCIVVKANDGAENEFVATVNITPYQSRVVNIVATPLAYTVDWAQAHGSQLPNTNLVWPGGTNRPSYSGAITPTNPSFTFPSAPASPIEYNGQLLYFKYWQVEGNTKPNNFQPGERIDDVFNTNKLGFKDNDTTITLYAQYEANASANDPVTAEYTLKIRQPNNGEQAQYAEIKRSTSLPKGGSYRFTAGESYSPIDSDRLSAKDGTWSFAGIEKDDGTLDENPTISGTAFNPETDKFPTFVYEHDQVITFEKGTEADAIGDAPAPSTGLSYDKVTLTPSGVDGSGTPTLTREGYTLVGWKSGSTQYRFDDDTNSVTIERPWGPLTLEPIWEIVPAKQELTVKDIDYKDETITFEGTEDGKPITDFKSVEVSGTGLSGSLKQNGSYELTNVLNNWSKNGKPFGTGKDTMTVTLEATDSTSGATASADIWHRPAAPKNTNISTTSALDGGNTGTITVTPTGDESYEYSTSNNTNAIWTAMDKVDGKYVASNRAAGTYFVRVSAVDNGNNAYTDGNFAGAAAQAVVGRSWTVAYKFEDGNGQNLSNEVYTALKAVTGNNAEAAEDAMAAFFDEDGDPLSAPMEQGRLNTIKTHWTALKNAMSGYGMSVKVKIGDADETTYKTAPSTPPTITNTSTVTFVFTLNNVTLEFDYNGDGHVNWYEGGQDDWPAEAKKRVTPYGGNDPIGTLPSSSKDDNPDKMEYPFWLVGYRFIGWTTQRDAGDPVTEKTTYAQLFNDGKKSTATIFGKWEQVDYNLALTAPQDWSSAYGYDPTDATANIDINFNGTKDVAFEIANIELIDNGAEQNEKASNFQLVTTGSQPLTGENAIEQIQVKPVGDLSVGTYTAKVQVKYSGIDGGLNLGENVKTAEVTITFTVTQSQANIEFGEIDYVNERILITGDQAPKTLEEAQNLEIEGMPEGFDPADENNWYVNNDQVWLNLSDALDTGYDDTQDSGWASDGGEVTLKVTGGADENHSKGSDTTTFNVRAKAPELADPSETPRAEGEGAKGTVAMAAPPEGRAYEHLHNEDPDNQNWLPLNDSSASGAATAFTDAAGTYSVRLSAENGEDGFFASREKRVEIEQWFWVSFKLEAKSWNDEPVDLEDATVTNSAGAEVKLGKQIGRYASDGTVDFSTDSDNVFAKVENGTNGKGTLVKEHSTAKLPKFGAGEGNWETPGYDLVGYSIDFKSTDGGDLPSFGGPDLYSTTESPAIIGDATITLSFKERTFNVAWSVDKDDSIGESESYNGKTPTTQQIPWSEMVRTQLLVNLGYGDIYWQASDSSWVGQYFVSTDSPVDPIDVTWGSYLRSPWALKTNDNNYLGFQVAQPIAEVAGLNPTDYFKAAVGGNASSWRDAKTLTFAVVYYDAEGAYGVNFQIAGQDFDRNYTVGNMGQKNRVSFYPANDENAATSQVRSPNGSEVSGANQRFSGTNSVFSGWFLDIGDMEAGANNQQANTWNGNTLYGALTSSAGTNPWSKPFDTSKPVSEALDGVFGGLASPETANKGVRPVPYDHEKAISTGEDGKVTPEQGDAQDYNEYFFPGYQVPDTAPTTGDALPNGARVDLVARIENANVTPTLKLQPAGEQGKLNSITGTIDLTPEEYWLNTTEGKLASEKNAAAETPSFEITGVTVVNPSGGNWLTAALGNVKTMGDGDSTASVTLDPENNLAPGTYSATVQVSYTYTSTTGAKYQLTINVPVEFTVTAEGGLAGSETDGYLATAHDFATTKSWADSNLNGADAIAKYTDFTAWTVADGVWTEATASDITSDPASVGSKSTLDENNGVKVTITATVDSHEVAATPTIYLYDNGTVPGGEGADNDVYVFANNATTDLPTKDSNNTGTTELNNWLVGLTEAAAFDTTAGWTKVTPAVTSTDGLRTAVPTDVKDDASGESGEHAVTLNAFGTTTTATVTLDRAPYPGVPGNFEQDVDATTSDTLVWTAAAPNNSVGTGSIAAKNNYVPSVVYKVTSPDGSDQDVNDTQLTSAKSNTEYKVEAYHEQTRVYWGAKNEGDYTLITATSPAAEGSAWTRPAVPEDLDHSYDYENETLSYEGSYTEGKQADSTDANVTLSDELEDAATANTILSNVVELAEAAANGDPMPLALTAPKDVSKLAGTQTVKRANGTDSQTFEITATGTESGLEAANALTVDTVPQRAATPALKIEQPLASGDPAKITGFDPEYVNDDGTSLYQASTDGKAWGNVTFDKDGAATVTSDGTLTLDGDKDNGYTWNIPSGNTDTFQFRVLHEDEATAEKSTAEADAHFKSLVQTKPANGGDFTVTEGAYISAKDFTVGANELIAWGMDENGKFSDNDQEFMDAAGARAQVTIGNQQDDMVWKLDYTNARPVEGSYTVTFKLYENADSKTEIGSAEVTMTVVTSGGAQDPNASIYASDFVVGVDEVTTIDKAMSLAWTRSQAHGTTKAGTELEQSGVTIAFAQDDTPITEDGQFKAGESYSVTFTVNDSYSSATVTMTVYDHVTQGDTYIIASNDFMAGANELVENSGDTLTGADAASRANVTLYEIDNPAVAIEGIPGEGGNITVDLANAWGKTAEHSPIKDGAVFTATKDAAATTASNITVTTDGSGSVDGQYFIGANDYHLGRNQLSGLNEDALAKLFFRSAGVTGKNAGTALAESGYGTAWTVEVDGVTLGSESAWENDSYQVTFTLVGEDATDYAATVTMHLHDNGSTGEVDGQTYAIFSDNFDMDDDEYSTLFEGEDFSELFERANIEVYQVNDNGFYKNADTNDVNVDASAFPESACVAGATNAGPVVFYLGASAADAPRAESFVTVHGGYVEDEDGNYIQAEHFVMGLNELTDSGWMPGETLAGEDALLESVVGYANAKAMMEGKDDPIASATASGAGAWAEGTYTVTFTSENDQTVKVTMTVYDNVYRPDPDDPDYDADNAYVVASNDFRISEAMVDTVTNEELIRMGEVAVWRASDLQTKLSFTASDITVGRGNLTGKKAGEPASVDYTYKPGGADAKVTSNVTIFAGGGTGTGEGEELASIWANRIITTQEQIDAITGDAASWLYTKAGVVGTDITGAALDANYDETQVKVTINDEAPTKDAIKNGAEVTFTVLDGDGNPTSVTATVPVVIYDDGGSGTDDNGTTYEIGAYNFRAAISQLTEDGLLSGDDNYSKLQDAARVVATMRPQGGAAQTLGYEDVSVGTGSQLDDLANGRIGGTYPLTFGNMKAAEAKVPGVEATVNVTVYGTGGENEEGYFLYANSFVAKYADLTAEDVDLFTLFYNGAQVAAGQNDKALTLEEAAHEVGINIKVGDEWIPLGELDTVEGFDNWLSDTYQVQFTYKGLSYQVTMLVGSDAGQGTDPENPDNPDASINITATSFATSLVQLGKVADDGRLGWLVKQANVQTMVDGTMGDGTVSYKFENGSWPTATGDYQLTFTVTEGNRSASATVTMSVFDRSSEDGDQGGIGDETPVSDENYIIYSNDYTVSQAERDADTLTNEELVRRGGAVAYSAADPYNPLPATDLVAGTDALAAAKPGDTFPVPYTLAESYGSQAKAVSAVYMTKGGATTDPTDPTDPSAGVHAIYANDIYIGRDEQPEAWSFEQVMQELVLRGVSSVVTDGAEQPLAEALANGKVQAYVGDTQLTADTVADLLGDWSFDELDIRFQHADNADAYADVTIVMRDHGGTVTDPEADPDDPARVLYMVFSDDFTMSTEEGSLLSDQDVLFERANVYALGRRGDAMTPLAPSKISWTTTLKADALAAGTYKDAVTFLAPAEGEDQAQSMSTVTIYDGGTQNESGAIWASDFYMGLDELTGSPASVDDALAKQMFERAGGAVYDATGKNVTDTATVRVASVEPAGDAWARGAYTVTFEAAGMGEPALTATVTMYVSDHVMVGDTYTIVSNDFRVAEGDVDKLAADPEQLLALGGVRVFENVFPHTALDVSTDTAKVDQHISGLAAGQAGTVDYTVIKDSKAMTTSNVTVYKGGSTDTGDPSDPSDDASIFANDVVVGRNEEPQTWSLATLMDELISRAGVVATKGGAEVEPTAENIKIYVNGSDQPIASAGEIDWSRDAHSLRFELAGTELSANVMLYVRDAVSPNPGGEGGGSTDPDASKAQIAASNFVTSVDSINANKGALDELFYKLAQVTGTDTDGTALTQGNVLVTVDGTPVDDVQAWKSGTYQITFTVEGDPDATVTVTMDLRDHGTDPEKPGTVDPGTPGGGEDPSQPGGDQPGSAHASIYANDFTVNAQTGLAGAQGSADKLAELLYEAAQVIGTTTEGTDFTGADDVVITINGTSLEDVAAAIADGSWTWDNKGYTVEFAVAGAPDVTASVTMTVTGVDKSSMGGNDFTVDPGDLEGLTPEEIEDMFFDQAGITGTDPDGNPIDRDDIEITVNGKPIQPGQEWPDGTYEVTFTTPWGDSITVILTIKSPAKPVEPGKPEEPQDKLPQTDDPSLVMLPALLASGSAALLAGFFLLLWRRRRDDEEEQQAEQAV